MGLFGKIASMVGGSSAAPSAGSAVKEPESQEQPVRLPMGQEQPVPSPVGEDLDCFDSENEPGATAQEPFQAGTPELLEPIEGVTLEAYAAIVGQLVAGGDLDTLVRQAGLDRARYDRVAEGWGARMAQDATFAVAIAYGAAFTAASNQARGAENGPSMSWERYIEVQEAMSELTKVGMDPQAVLQQLGTTLAAYSADGMHYSEWFNANAVRDPEIVQWYHEYSNKYQAKYAAAKQDQDLQF